MCYLTLIALSVPLYVLYYFSSKAYYRHKSADEDKNPAGICERKNIYRLKKPVHTMGIPEKIIFISNNNRTYLQLKDVKTIHIVHHESNDQEDYSLDITYCTFTTKKDELFVLKAYTCEIFDLVCSLTDPYFRDYFYDYEWYEANPSRYEESI